MSPSPEAGSAPEEISTGPTRQFTDEAPRAQYDPSYFLRHDKRNRKRVQAIVESLTPGARALDIGCNRGYFSRGMLESGLIAAVDGIEPMRDHVDPALLEDERFELHTGDVVEFDFAHRYHAIVYCAVHHHVLGHSGYVAAFELWRRIVDSCDRFIFFETGHVLEGSRWYWQRAIRRHFGSDEEHIGALLQAVGPRLEGVEVIGQHRIHGTRRWLLRIDLLPPESPHTAPAVAGPGLSELTAVSECRRTVGRWGQALVERSASGEFVAPEGQVVHEGVEYTRCTARDAGSAGGEQAYWCKRSAVDPWLVEREILVGSQIEDPRFVRPVAVHPEFGAVYPYIEAETLSAIDLKTISNRHEIVDGVIAIHDAACEIMIDTRDLDLDPRARGSRRRLVDLIDLHPANVLVARDGDRLEILGAIDLEYFRNHNKARNAAHLGRLIRAAGLSGPKYAARRRAGVVESIRHHAEWSRRPIEDRLYEKYATRLRAGLLPVLEWIDRVLKPVPGRWQ